MNNTTLCQLISQYIAGSPQQRVTFAEYMDMALYHPEQGYYSTKAVNLGKKGDFFTSVHLGADFGELLGEQFFQMWEILGQPGTFTLVEMGAGQGHLASDILIYLQQHYPEFFALLEYVIVEKSPALKQEQQQRLQDFSPRWCNLEEISTNSITGCFFSNELVDALPVHQFIIEQGQLREIYVTQNGGEFVEVLGEVSTNELVEYFDLVGIDINNYPQGYRSEINLAAGKWLSAVAERLQQGYVLTIDYGYSAGRYYNPRRNLGNLQCYFQHQRHDNPYINIGLQDITTHVDFTALETWGEHFGLNKLGFTQQALFLMSLGLGSRIAELSYQEQPLSQLLRRRDSLHQLLDPMGLGGFGVLIQCKGLTKTEISQPLKGLIEPS
jgi:SAM-dependent MidA family methyltransferase